MNEKQLDTFREVCKNLNATSHKLANKADALYDSGNTKLGLELDLMAERESSYMDGF